MNFILYLLITHYIGLFFHKKSSKLTCGLFGWVGEKPKTFSIDKFNILGIYNEVRGRHSCGVAIDGVLYKGTKETDDEEYTDFIIKQKYPMPKKIPVVIGHTRAATGSTPHTYDNAHPFKYVTKDEKDIFIGAHNGIIRNIEELAKKYNVENVRTRVDSDVLLEILSNNNEEVLTEYMGNAALLMYSSEDPNTLWVFKGGSKEYASDTEEKEERPLFYYKESETSMYISSLTEPLRVISRATLDDEKNIYSFATNVLYKITNGSIVDRLNVDRSLCLNGTTWRTNVRSFGNSNVRIEDYYDDNASCDTPNSQNCNVRDNRASYKDIVTKTYNMNTTSSSGDEAYKKNNIYYEKVIFDRVETDIYYENLRYKSEGKLVTGICIFLKETGFYKIADKSEDVQEKLEDFEIDYESYNQIIRFGDVSDLKLHYMYQGILLATELDYNACRSHLSSNDTKEIDFSKLSEMSIYPIINLGLLKENTKIYPPAQGITHNGELATVDLLEPLGSYRNYNISVGRLVTSLSIRKIIEPEGVDSMISLYDDGEWTYKGEEEEDNTISSIFPDKAVSKEGVSEDIIEESFEEGLFKELTNYKQTSVDKIIKLTADMSQTLEHTGIELERIDKEEDVKSSATTYFAEFITDTKKKFEPLKQSIMFKDEKEKV